jgi:hypothetical protein
MTIRFFFRAFNNPISFFRRAAVASLATGTTVEMASPSKTRGHGRDYPEAYRVIHGLAATLGELSRPEQVGLTL